MEKCEISVHPISGGLFQAHLHKQRIQLDDGIKLGDLLYSSKHYPTEDQAYQDAKTHYENYYK